MDRTLTITIGTSTHAKPRELAATLERLARSIGAVDRLEHRDEGVPATAGVTGGSLKLDAGQVSLCGPAVPLDRTMTIAIAIAPQAKPHELAAAVERIARSIRAMGRLERRVETVPAAAGVTGGSLRLDAGQASLFGAAGE